MSEWFEKFFDGLYAKVLDKQFDEAATLRHVCAVKRLLRLRKGQRVLDIPCGLGRLAIPLARMGFDMTGVDLVPAYVRRARRRARREGLDIRFVRSDMRNIAFDREFDAAFNYFTSVGYFSDGDNLAFCRKVSAALKPGGRFLVETMNRSWILTHFQEKSSKIISGVRIIDCGRWDARRRRVISTWTLRKWSTVRRRRVSVRLYTGPELRAMLRAAGFRDIVLYGYPPLGRLTRHSRRLIVVARRP